MSKFSKTAHLFMLFFVFLFYVFFLFEYTKERILERFEDIVPQHLILAKNNLLKAAGSPQPQR